MTLSDGILLTLQEGDYNIILLWRDAFKMFKKNNEEVKRSRELDPNACLSLCVPVTDPKANSAVNQKILRRQKSDPVINPEPAESSIDPKTRSLSKRKGSLNSNQVGTKRRRL